MGNGCGYMEEGWVVCPLFVGNSGGDCLCTCVVALCSVGGRWFSNRFMHVAFVYTWVFLPFSVCMLLMVPNPACSPMTAIQGLHLMSERSYKSATNQMDLCQLWSVTSELRYNYHINSVMFLKLVFQINRYKVKWGSAPLDTMSNSDSHVELFLPSVPVLQTELTCVHLVLHSCRNIESCCVVLSCTLARSGRLTSSKIIISQYIILMSFKQPDNNWLHVLTTILDINTSFTHQS